jgi:ribosome-binding factor A
MKRNRSERLNSLLKEVISEVIVKDVHNPHLTPLTSVSRVEITSDLRQAKVFISVIGSEEDRERTKKALQSAAGFIAVQSSKKVVMRYFPELTFYIDRTVDQQMKIENILQKIHAEEKERKKIEDKKEDGSSS